MKLVITLYSLHHFDCIKLGHTKQYSHNIMLVSDFPFVHLCVGISDLIYVTQGSGRFPSRPGLKRDSFFPIYIIEYVDNFISMGEVICYPAYDRITLEWDNWR